MAIGVVFIVSVDLQLSVVYIVRVYTVSVVYCMTDCVLYTVRSVQPDGSFAHSDNSVAHFDGSVVRSGGRVVHSEDRLYTVHYQICTICF